MTKQQILDKIEELKKQGEKLDKKKGMIIHNLRRIKFHKPKAKGCKHVGDKSNFNPQFCKKCGKEFMYDIFSLEAYKNYQDDCSRNIY